MESSNADICAMHQAYLLLGSNQGDRTSYLNQARERLKTLGSIRQCSSFYETAAWGFTEQPAFLNQALLLETELEPLMLLASILHIEQNLGRERKERYGPRTLDIDILLYDNLIFQHERLTIPHPELTNRRFALTALSEIAGTAVHPVFKRTLDELLTQCSDSLAVTRLT